MKILVFDNYDSFTYNLVHLVKSVSNANVEVHRNDEITLAEIKKFDKIILSPGPGLPKEANLLLQVIKEYSSTKSILGVCLGHQAIGEYFGGELKQLSTVFHGVATKITHNEKDRLFKNISDSFLVGRYHSWVVNNLNLPTCFTVTASDADNNIMAMRHKTLDVKGVQFHPESILTQHGETLMKNWIVE